MTSPSDNLPNMLGRRSTASAHDAHALPNTGFHLLRIVYRIAVVVRPPFLDMRIARVGHRAEPLSLYTNAGQQFAHMVRTANAVQPDRVHIFTDAHFRNQFFRLFACPRKAIRACGKGNQDECLRTTLSDMAAASAKPLSVGIVSKRKHVAPASRKRSAMAQ